MVKYVLTGATGELGSRIFRNLLKLVQPSDVIVSLYNPAGATDEIKASGVEVRRGDFTQPSTLDAAFAGADKLLLVSCPTIVYETSLASHKAAIDAARRVGIKHIYYTSLILADDSKAMIMQAHLATEAYLKESGVGYTIIRMGIYSESWPLYFPWNPKKEGREVKVPAGDGGIAFVCRDDLGEGTAKLMVEDTHENEIVKFTGSRVYTLTELAGIISKFLNLDPPLALKIVSEDEYVTSNERDEELLRKWATTFPALARGELAVVDPLLQEILGRELRSFEERLREALDVDTEVAVVDKYSK